ncbi:MAG: dCMP deaminase family protein [Firmicutes bacterium]|nr:dCMP deaminase family protein [Bacillota bacterium]
MDNIVSKKWDKRFMDVAKLVSGWSSCIREGRQVGCVIAKNKRIITTGYNGASSGIENCAERGACMRTEMGIQSGTRHEMCYAAHAEQNAIVQAARLGVSVDGATLYCTHQPCAICSKLIINSGISRIVYEHPYPDDFAVSMLKEACVALVKLTPEE